MALFGFDPGDYGPSQGSLIDRLIAGLQQQGQYQPSPAGFPATPEQQPQQPMQAQPVSIGGYQMPRIGAADLYQPAAALPENAQPAQGVLPQAVAQQASQPQAAPQAPMLPQPYSSPGGFGGAVRGALANLQGGPLGLLGGAIAGGIGLGQGTEQEQQAHQQRALIQAHYTALVNAGVPPQKAMLAAISPEAAKKIVDEQFGSDNFSVAQTGENDLGRKTYQVFNKKTGEFRPIPGSADTGAASAGGLGDMSKTGPEYLASLPKDQQNIVKGMAEGTIQPPSSFALSKPYWTKMIAAAQNYDPTFDATKWSGRVAGVKDFSAGKSSEMVRSANQTLHHVGQLLDSMDNLKNGDYPLANRVGNAVAEATGSGAQGAFRTNAHAVAEELSKVFKGSNLSDAEIHAWEQNLHENMSPEQQRAQIAKLRDLLKGSLDALEEKRLNSIGPIAAQKQGPLIKEEGQKVLERIDSWVSGPKGAAPQKTKTGVKWSVE